MSIDAALSEALWPQARLAEALRLFAEASGLRSAQKAAHLADPPEACSDESDEPFSEWLRDCAGRLGIEAAPAMVMYPELQAFLRGRVPALLRIPDPQGKTPFYALLLRGGRRGAWLIDPSRRRRFLPIDALAQALLSPLRAPHLQQADALLLRAEVKKAQRPAASEKLIATWLQRTPVPGIHILRLPETAAVRDLAKHTGLQRTLFSLVGYFLASLLLSLIGALALSDSVLWGRPSWGYLCAFGLAMLSQLPIEARREWLQGQLALRTSAALGRRLLAGTFRLPPQSVRSAGIGQFLGLVLESETLGRLLFSGLPGLLLCGLELFVCMGILVAAGLPAPLLILLLTLAAFLFLLYRYHHALRCFIEQRLHFSTALIERMLGHRTRLVQESPAYWHRQEDELLSEYQAASLRADRLMALLLGGLPRAWLLCGVVSLLPMLLQRSLDPALALGLGVVLYAQRALTRLMQGGLQLIEAKLAYDRCEPLFSAAAQEEPLGALLPGAARNRNDKTDAPANDKTLARQNPLLELVRVSYRYPAQPQEVLSQVDVAVHRGDRVLVQGPSGGGKSTMASLFLGLESPASGAVLLSGLDLPVLGLSRWRRRIAGAPQFQLNHVLSESLAFNLLLGRRWPARQADLQEAQRICEALRLGPLLERMPGGLFQMVGDSGWQLSHGERSRVFLARALLQKTDVVIFDESFAALDPETLRDCLSFVLKHCETLIVIAHP